MSRDPIAHSANGLTTRVFAMRALAIFVLLFLAACSAKKKGDSKLRITLPKAVASSQKVGASAVNLTGLPQDPAGWLDAVPQDASDLTCYLVVVGGPDDVLRKNSCTMASGTILRFGSATGLARGGETLELEVPSGANREIHVFALKALNGEAACLPFAGLNRSQYSAPLRIGQAIQDLTPGENVVTINAEFNSSDENRLRECAGIENVDPGTSPSPSPIPTPSPTPSVSSIDFSSGANSALENAGNQDVVVTVSPANASNTITVNWSLSGSASVSDHSLGASGTLTFNPGVTSQTISFTVTSDSIDESNETVVLTLSAPTNANLGTTIVHTHTITDDDAAPGLSISDAAVIEGGVATFTATLSAASSQNVTFDYTANSGGNATATTDYTAVPTTSATIAAGASTTTFTVQTTPDALAEANETFDVVLSNPVNAVLVDFTGIGTINDDDGPPALNISSATVTEGGNLVFTASLTSASGSNATFDWATSDGSATLADSDYTNVSLTSVTILAGQTNITLTVSTGADPKDEIDETVTATISNVQNVAAGTLVATGTITDDDAEPNVQFVVASQNTAGVESGTVTLTLNLSQVSGKQVIVPLSIGGVSTATDPADYSLATTSLTIAAGSVSAFTSLTVSADVLDENDETVVINIGTPTNATVGAVAIHTVTINDDDASPSITLAAGSALEASPLLFTITQSAVSGRDVMFTFTANSGGNAIAGTDYTTATGAIYTITAGATMVTVAIPTTADVLDETDETFAASISGPINATLGIDTATGTITDDDATPSLSITDANAIEANSIVFTVSLSSVSGLDVSFTLNANTNYSATPAVDYSSVTNQVFTIATGATSQVFTISTLTDTTDEVDETFDALISGAANATIADSTGIGTINDDDNPPAVLTISDGAVYTFAQTATGGTRDYTFTVTNTGLSSATAISTGGLAAPYSYFGGTCGATLGASATCTLIVRYAPTVSGYTTDSIDITYNDSAAAQAASRTVEGTAATPALLTISDPGYDYGTVVTGSSTDKVFTLTNSGGFNATAISEVGLGGPFALKGGVWPGIGGTCNMTLSSGGNCTFVVTYAPGITGVHGSNIQINYTDGAASTSATRSITGTAVAPAQLTISGPEPRNYGNVPVGSYFDQTFTISNTGGANATGLAITSLASPYTFNGGYPGIGGDCTASLAPAGTCTVVVRFQPTVSSVQNETLDVDYNDGALPQIASRGLTGVGVNPSLSIAPAVEMEGSPVVFTITSSVPISSGNITFTFNANSGGNAIAGTDYTTVNSQVLTILPGQNTVTVAVATSPDVQDEFSETFDATIFGPSNAAIGTGAATGTINDDDAEPTLSITDPSATEGSSLVFTVSLSSVSGKNVTFDWSTSDNTATLANSDYTSVPLTTVTIIAGSANTTLTVLTTTNNQYETAETVNVNLSAPTNATFADNVGIGTISNDDPTPVAQFNIGSYTYGEAVGNVNVTVSLDTPSGAETTIPYSVSGSATGGGSDHNLSAGVLTIPAGSMNGMISLSIIDDATAETNETIIISLSAPTNANLGGIATHTLTINDNDTVPPTAPGPVLDGNVHLSVGGRSPRFFWAPSSPGTNSIARYEVALGTSPGATDVQAWTDVALNTDYQFMALSLNPFMIYYASVRAVDTASVFSSVSTSDGWKSAGFEKAVAPSASRIADANFGYSVAISENGTTMAIGVPDDGLDATHANNVIGAGAVYVFLRSGSTWTLQQKIVATGTNARMSNDLFGSSVALSSETLVVGAPGQDYDANGGGTVVTDAGAAFVYLRSSGIWSLQQKLVGTGTNGRVAGDTFGGAVAIALDTVVVGAKTQDTDASGTTPVTDAGAAYVFFRTGSTWAQQAKLVPSGPNARVASDFFGASVSIYGDTAAIGAYAHSYDTSGGALMTGAGAAFVFTRSGSTWSLQQKVTPTGAGSRTANDSFGYSVSVFVDTLLIGAPFQDWDHNGANSLTDAGAAFIFTRSGSTWTQQHKLVGMGPGARGPGDNFGRSVSIAGPTLVVGAQAHQNDEDGSAPLTNAGAAFLFSYETGQWKPGQKLIGVGPSGRNANDYFGQAVAISADTVVVGATGQSYDPAGSGFSAAAGAAYFFYP